MHTTPDSSRIMSRLRPYPAYKSSGVDWLGEMPAHWQVKRLKATVTVCQNGIWGDEPDGERDILCVRVADFDRVALRVDLSNPTLRSIEPGLARDRMLVAGDLLLEKSGGGDLQPVRAVVVYDHNARAVCSNFIARMTVAKGFIPRFRVYLHAVLYAARLNVRSIKQSTGLQNLDSQTYLTEQVALPDSKEQLAIVRFSIARRKSSMRWSQRRSE
jgi:type I restriction enzyme, S subunit